MGFLERMGLRKDWGKETAKLGQEEEAGKIKKGEELKKAQAEAGEEKRGKETMTSLTQEALGESKAVPYEKIMRAYRESLTGEGEQRENKMLAEVASELTSPYTAKAENILANTGRFFEKNLKKFGGAAEAGLTTAKDLTKRGAGAALRGIKETGLNVADFVNKYSGVAADKYKTTGEWVKVNAAREWNQGVEAYHKLQNGVGEVKSSLQQQIKEWPEKRALARAEKRMIQTKEAVKRGEEAQAERIEQALQARQDYQVLKETFEQST